MNRDDVEAFLGTDVLLLFLFLKYQQHYFADVFYYYDKIFFGLCTEQLMMLCRPIKKK